MREITLANGAHVPDVLVSTTMVALRTCLERHPLAFYDLVMVCRREPGYVPFGDNGERLRSLGLLQTDGQPHGAVRDIVLSAVTGDLMDMALGDPLADDGPSTARTTPKPSASRAVAEVESTCLASDHIEAEPAPGNGWASWYCLTCRQHCASDNPCDGCDDDEYA